MLLRPKKGAAIHFTLTSTYFDHLRHTLVGCIWVSSGEMREVLRGGHGLRFRAPAREEDHLPRFEACDLLRARDHDHLEETPMKQRQKLKDDICYIRILGKIMKDKYGEVN